MKKNLYSLFLLVAISSFTYGQKPIASYSFNSNLNDLSGNNNLTLTSYPPTFVADEAANPSSALDVVTQYNFLSTPSIPAIEGKNSRTIAARVKFSNETGWYAVVGYGQSTAGKRFSFGIQNRKLRAEFGGASTQYATNLDTDTWYHIAVTYDGTNIELFLDGVSVISEVENSVDTGSNSIIIGNDQTNTPRNRGFIGTIDDVRIYSGELTEAQINDLDDNNVCTGCTATLEAQYDFSNNANDSSGNGRNLTIAPAFSYGNDKNDNGNNALSNVLSTNFLATSSNFTAIEGNASRTIMANIRFNNTNSWKTIASLGVDETLERFSFLVNGNNNRLRAEFNGGSVQTDVALTANTWYHVAVTYDGTNVKLFIDGVEEKSGTVTLNTGSNPLMIGNDYSSPTNRGFDGSIDNLRIYDTALTAGEVSAMSNNDLVSWVGTTNDWATASNWDSNIVPLTTDDVVIPSDASNYPTAATTVTVDNITIKSGASFIANAGYTGNATYQRNLENGEQWYLMSSPINGETYDDTWNTTNGIDTGDNANNTGVSWYLNTTADINTDHWRYFQSGDAASAFNVAQGYAIRRANTGGDISFSGNDLYTSTQTFALTQNTNNYNLVGNPFTASFNLGDFFTDNGAGVISGAQVWFWNGSSYEVRTAGSHGSYEIAPGQGFFVEAANETNLTFDYAHVNHTSSTFQKAQQRPEIALKLTEGSNTRKAYVYYIDGSTTSYDTGYDGNLFEGVSDSLAIYTDLIENDGKKYQIQALPNSDYEKNIIAIGIIAEAGKELTFSAEALNLPEGLKVYLEDRTLNTLARLDENNTDYKVTLTKTLNGTGRFYLHTKSSALSSDEISLGGVSVYLINKDKLRVIGINSTNASIKLFNILGKQVLNTSFSSTGATDVSLPNLTFGVYIVQLSTEKGSTSKKIVLE